MSKKKKEEVSEESPEKDKATEAGAEGEEGAEGGSKKGKKKLVFIAGGAGALILIVVGVLLSGVLGGGDKGEHKESPEEVAAKEAAAALAAKPVYYELPEFLVNLNASGTSRVSFLKMSVTLELRDPAAVLIMDANKPRILDIFNTYLRELKSSDVQGSAGIYRLRTELLTRLNSTIEDGTVKDILFGEIIVQ